VLLLQVLLLLLLLMLQCSSRGWNRHAAAAAPAAVAYQWCCQYACCKVGQHHDGEGLSQPTGAHIDRWQERQRKQHSC
jgi:hypothetical protein